MSPEEKELLQKTFFYAEENNRMLRRMHRNTVWSMIFQLTYWLIIIGLSVGVYYYIEPYVKQLTEAYTGAKANIDSLNTGASNLLQEINNVKLPR